MASLASQRDEVLQNDDSVLSGSAPGMPSKTTGLIASDTWCSLAFEVNVLAGAFDDEEHASDQELEDQSPCGAVSISSLLGSTSGFDSILPLT